VRQLANYQPMVLKKIVEVGPGKVLQGLNKRINKAISTVSLNTIDSLQQAIDLSEG
jgi:[acyl-carrier-protein] S-malonyltransferase